MKKITKLFLLAAVMLAWGSVAYAQTSNYCSTPSGHLNNPTFGDANSHISLTIENISANSIRVTVAKRAAGADIDYLRVEGGTAPVEDGADATTGISQRSVIVNFTSPGTNVTLNIMWSNPNWAGRWAINALQVPFAATCAPVVADTEAPTAFTATKGAVTGSSVELLLKATDNSGAVTYTVTYGSTSFDVIGTSNVEKSHIVTGLMQSTAYSFSIVAKDAAGNSIPTPIVVAATTTAQPTNLIVNGDFANGIASWTFSSPGTVSNGEAYFSTANAGGNPWDTELKQTGKSFISGTSYTLSFRARAALNRNISVNIQNTNIWNDQFRNNAVALTTTMTTYTYVFNATSTNTNAQLNFHMANMGANTTAAVYIDDVSIIVSPTADTTPPVMGTATVVGSPAFNSVNLLLAATDNVTSPVTSFVANDATNGITDKAFTADASGNGTVSGLTASTSYNLVIKAKDSSGNVSANSATVSFTTPAAPAVSTINFETVGQDWTWTVAENASNPALEFVNNPSATGINTSAKAAKFTATATGNPWALVHSNSRPYVISTDNKIIKVMVYKDRISDFGLKLETTGGDLEIKVPNTLINQWEELTFDFSSKVGSTANVMVIIPDFLARTVATINYFDNISFSNGLTTSLGSTNSENSIRCYPNPAKNSLTVSAKSEINAIRITNLVGQTIKNVTVNAVERVIDLNNISNGQYIISLSMKNGQIVNQKFTKK